MTLRSLAILALGLVSSALACGGADATEGPDASPQQASVTYCNQVVRLLQDHCQSCHRPEGLAPFSLLTYEDAKSRASLLEEAVASHRMPEGMPVRIDTGCSDAETFLGPRRLSASEIETFATWAAEGTPEGDIADLPPPRDFPDGEWLMGQPDIEMPNTAGGFLVPSTLQRDIFRRFVIPTNLASDQYITGFEAIPGAAGGTGLSHIVHHVTLFVAPSAPALARESAYAESNPEVPGAGFEGDFGFDATLVGMWFPGSQPLLLKDGLGIRLPQGAALVAEVHYSPSQETLIDETRIGLLLKEEVDQELVVGLVKNEEFTVPADDSAFRVHATKHFDAPATLYSITPHMHQLGTDFKVVINRPSGETCLADVEWDFEHQGTYWLRDPMLLPAGSIISTTCDYDNSVENPNQFNFPPQDILFGKVADREMCQLTAGMVVESTPPPPAPRLAEVLYDAEGADTTAEWIKLHNPGNTPIDLANYSIGWGGSNYTYGRLQLSGNLPANSCAVVGAPQGDVPGVSTDFVPDLQNGGTTADGIALFTDLAQDIGESTVPIDSVVYGDANDNGLINASGAVAGVDVASAAPGQSIRRNNNGTWSMGAPSPSACP